MFEGFCSCSLIVFDDLLSVFGDLLSEFGFEYAFFKNLLQLFSVLDHDCSAAFEECIYGLSEVEGVRAEDGAFSKCGSFHHIRAAHWYEASSDKDDFCQRVKFSQISHGVAEDDGLFVGDGCIVFLFDFAVSEECKSSLFYYPGYLVKSFRFSGDNYESVVSALRFTDNISVGIEDDGFFIVSGSSGDN